MSVKVYGLTGPTGSGKSVVAKALEKSGFDVIDADQIARQVVFVDSCQQKLVNAFGENILDTDGTLKRSVLAEKAFSSPENTKLLNAITHPEILKIITDRLDQNKKNNICSVIDAPLLFEAGADRLCDKIIAVISPVSMRLERIISRDNLSNEQALLRINAQKCDNFYTDKADYVLINDGDLKKFEETIMFVLGDLLK